MQKDNEAQIWQGKRKQQIDNDGPVNKKMLKNQRKKKNKQQKNQEQLDQYLNQSSNINKDNELKKKPLSKQQKLQSLTLQLQKVYVQCSKQIIRKCLLQADFNMQLAANLIIQAIADEESSMLDVFDKNDKNNNKNNSNNNNNNKKNNSNNNKYKQQPINSNNNKNNNKNNNNRKPNQTQQQGHKLLNQFYDKGSQIDISGFQFQQLFNQITQIIKQDQKSKGKGLIQINNFVQQCMTAKQTILVGLKDVFQIQQDIYIDQNDPIYAQLQQYIYDLTQKQIRQEVIKAEDFPTFGQASNKKKNQNNKNTNNKQKINSPIKQSIVNSLQNQNKIFNGPITKNDFFTGSNNKRPVLFQQKNSKGIFNIDNQQQSQDALRGLHKQFNHVSIQSLKVAYLLLQRNYNECRIFLNKYYGQYAKEQKKIQYQTNFIKPRKSSFKKHLNFSFRKQSIDEIDEQLKQMSFSQLRSQIQHLYNLRQVFKMTCEKIKNTNQRKQLMRMLQQKAPANIIRKLSKAARVKLIQQTMQRNPNFVDLHGHREQQIDAILQGLIASIKHQFNQSNDKVKYKMVGGRTEAVLQVLTGKGRHSLYGKSVLKPYVKNWCESRNIRAIVNDDNVEIYLPLLL